MSISKQITVWCDAEGCAEWHQESAQSVDRLRKELRPRGWRCVNGKDYCPEHAGEAGKRGVR